MPTAGFATPASPASDERAARVPRRFAPKSLHLLLSHRKRYGAYGTCRCTRAPAGARTPWGLWARGGPQGRSGSQRGGSGGQAPPVSNQTLPHSSVVRTRRGGDQQGNILSHKITIHTAVGKVYELALLFNNSTHFLQQQPSFEHSRLFGAPRRVYQASLFL